MRNFILTVAVLSGAAFFLLGCAGRPTRLEANWGRSFETQRSLQIANPKAGKRLSPITGIDGQSAAVIMDEYRKGFISNKAHDTVNIIKLH